MRPYLFAILLTALSVSDSAAQSVRGSISGTVTDPGRKPLTGATITLTEESTNKKRTAVSGSQGEFFITLVSPGIYQLEIDHAGYRKYVQPLILAVNQELHVTAPLLPGTRTEQIVVTAPRSMVRTDSAA